MKLIHRVQLHGAFWTVCALALSACSPLVEGHLFDRTPDVVYGDEFRFEIEPNQKAQRLREKYQIEFSSKLTNLTASDGKHLTCRSRNKVLGAGIKIVPPAFSINQSRIVSYAINNGVVDLRVNDGPEISCSIEGRCLTFMFVFRAKSKAFPNLDDEQIDALPVEVCKA